MVSLSGHKTFSLRHHFLHIDAILKEFLVHFWIGMARHMRNPPTERASRVKSLIDYNLLTKSNLSILVSELISFRFTKALMLGGKLNKRTKQFRSERELVETFLVVIILPVGCYKFSEQAPLERLINFWSSFE
jgi:hypothetical protein